MLRREIDYLQQDIFGQQDVKKRQQSAIYQLKNDIRYKEKENEVKSDDTRRAEESGGAETASEEEE